MSLFQSVMLIGRTRQGLSLRPKDTPNILTVTAPAPHIEHELPRPLNVQSATALAAHAPLLRLARPQGKTSKRTQPTRPPSDSGRALGQPS